MPKKVPADACGDSELRHRSAPLLKNGGQVYLSGFVQTLGESAELGTSDKFCSQEKATFCTAVAPTAAKNGALLAPTQSCEVSLKITQIVASLGKLLPENLDLSFRAHVPDGGNPFLRSQIGRDAPHTGTKNGS